MGENHIYDKCFNFLKTLFKIRFDWMTKFPYLKQTMKTQITMLLTTLAIFDILFLFCTFPLFSLQAMMHFKNFLNLCVYKGEKLFNSLNKCNLKHVETKIGRTDLR